MALIAFYLWQQAGWVSRPQWVLPFVLLLALFLSFLGFLGVIAFHDQTRSFPFISLGFLGVLVSLVCPSFLRLSQCSLLVCSACSLAHLPFGFYGFIGLLVVRVSQTPPPCFLFFFSSGFRGLPENPMRVLGRLQVEIIALPHLAPPLPPRLQSHHHLCFGS